MPIYVYKHPEDEKQYKEVIQGMNDKHTYSEDGVGVEEGISFTQRIH